MASPSELQRAERFERAAAALMLGVIAVGALVAIGWVLLYEPLIRLIPGSSGMSPLASICFMLSGAALWLRLGPRSSNPRLRRVALALAAGVFLIAFAAMFRSLDGAGFDINGLAIDLLGYPDPERAVRMHGTTVVTIMLTALAIALLDVRWPGQFCPSQLFAVPVLGLGLIAFEGFLFDYSSVALHSALAVSATGVALLLARPFHGLMLELVDDRNGALMARRVLPFVIVTPIVVAWFRLEGQRAGLYGLEIGLALFATSNICLFAFVVWLAARSINRSEHELEQAKHQFVQAQKMDAIGRLAGGIAHDFNNLLMVIKGNAELLSDSLPKQDLLRSEVEDIRAAADRAQALTQQLLAFSRKQVLTTQVVDVNEVVRSVNRLLQRLIGEHIAVGVVLTELPATVRADPHQLEQVLINLAVNARDAMPDGGRLSLRTSRIRHADPLTTSDLARDADPPPVEFVRIAVTDSGVGMDEATRQRVFEPFFTTKPVGQGTGLGLATVYGIVRQSGGSIWVASTPGIGSTFVIDLPFVAGAIEPVAPPKPTTHRPRSVARILLVEDEPSVRRVVLQLLEAAGHRVMIASDGEDALRAWETLDGGIDLLITDVVMPRLGGRELAERLRERSPTLRVLFMSGYTDDAVLKQSVGMRGAEFLSKPFEREALLSKVRRLLDQ